MDQVGESQMPSSTALEMSSTQGFELWQVKSQNFFSSGKYRAFAKLAKTLGWTNVAVLNFEEDSPTDQTYHDQLIDALSSESITVGIAKSSEPMK